MAFTSKVLALVARVLGKQYNINIAMGNYRTASTDGHTIYIPLVEGDSAVDLARGYIDHEAAHIRLTDMSIMPTRDFKGQLLNAVEDIRIEKGIGKDYPGCASNLRNLSAALEEKYGVFKPNPANPSTSILSWISCRGRVDTLAHDSMIASAEAAEPMARAIFGRHFAEAQRLVAMIKMLPEDKSGTKAAQDIRDQFMALLEQAKEDADNQPEPDPQEQEKEETPDDQQQDPSEGSADSDDSDDSDQPDDADSEAGDDTEGEEEGESETADSDDTDSATDDADSEAGDDTEGESETDADPDDSETEGDNSAEGGETSEGEEEEGSDAESDDSETDDAGSEDGDDSEGEEEGKSEADDADSEAGDDSDAGSDGDADGESDGQGGSDGDCEGEDDGESQNQNQGSSAGLGPAEMQAVKDALEEALGSDDVEFGDIGELLQELLGQEAVLNTYEQTAIPKLPMCVPHPCKDSSPFPDEALVKTHTAKLRAQLQGLIQASKLKRSIPRRVGRRLDNRTLTRLSVGDDRLFVSREEKKGVNTAVLLILDGSGSMDYQRPGDKMHTATRSCFVALEAMYAVPGVTAAAVEFNDKPNQVFNLCGWGQKPDSKVFHHNGSGGTELSTALWLGWAELLNRPEPRKIAVVFSDGDTSSDDKTHTRAAISRMKKDGIELVGIGIKDNHLLSYLPKETRIINNLQQLTPALLELLREKLVAA